MSAINLQCLLCLATNTLPPSYGASYRGPWRCYRCEALHRVEVTMSYVNKLEALDEMHVVSGNFPTTVSDSLREMVASYNAGAYRASAVMLRRSLEAACIEKGATGNNLANKIIDLGTRLGVLDAVEKAQATATRLFGNYGAHVGDDGLDDVTKKDAKRAIELGLELLKKLYS
jgi:Domain of unknown function (DUF4145)